MLAGICSGLTPDLSVKAGLNAAHLSLQCLTAVSPDLSPRNLSEGHIRGWAPWEARVVES